MSGVREGPDIASRRCFVVAFFVPAVAFQEIEVEEHNLEQKQRISNDENDGGTSQRMKVARALT